MWLFDSKIFLHALENQREIILVPEFTSLLSLLLYFRNVSMVRCLHIVMKGVMLENHEALIFSSQSPLLHSTLKWCSLLSLCNSSFISLWIHLFLFFFISHLITAQKWQMSVGKKKVQNGEIKLFHSCLKLSLLINSFL